MLNDNPEQSGRNYKHKVVPSRHVHWHQETQTCLRRHPPHHWIPHPHQEHEDWRRPAQGQAQGQGHEEGTRSAYTLRRGERAMSMLFSFPELKSWSKLSYLVGDLSRS